MIKLNKKGMTMLETIVALGIFGMVIISAVGLFVGGYNSHKKAVAMNNLQKEGGYLLERISREIRMASANDDISIVGGNSISFTNHEVVTTVYSLTGATVEVKYGAAANIPLSSSNVTVDELNFYKVGSQPIVIISMRLISARDTTVELLLQTSVVPRVY